MTNLFLSRTRSTTSTLPNARRRTFRMAKRFEDLRRKMPAQRQKRARARTGAMLAEIALSELRRGLGVTQDQLAKSLDVRQAAVSKLEGRDDVLLSTLSAYLAALGGTLEVVARFGDQASGSTRMPQQRRFAWQRRSLERTSDRNCGRLEAEADVMAWSEPFASFAVATSALCLRNSCMRAFARPRPHSGCRERRRHAHAIHGNWRVLDLRGRTRRPRGRAISAGCTRNCAAPVASARLSMVGDTPVHFKAVRSPFRGGKQQRLCGERDPYQLSGSTSRDRWTGYDAGPGEGMFIAGGARRR